MPLAKIANIHDNACWALWHISESLGELEAMLPKALQGAYEQERMTHTSRKQEWIAGRLAVLALVEHFRETFHGLAKDEFGKPFLVNSPLHLNLTHSFPYAAAIIHKHQPVGIDLEQKREKLGRLCPKFLSTQELAHAAQDLDKLCVYWTAKETVYKLYGKRKLIFKENIAIAPFELSEKGYLSACLRINEQETLYRLYYLKMNNFYLCFNV